MRWALLLVGSLLVAIGDVARRIQEPPRCSLLAHLIVGKGVDMARCDRLQLSVRPSAEEEAVYAFGCSSTSRTAARQRHEGSR